MAGAGALPRSIRVDDGCWLLGACPRCWAWPAPAQAGLEELIAAAKPSVVAVGVFNPTSSPRFAFRGSGFVVGAGNFVVTNAHVLPEVIPPGGSEGSLVVVVPTQAGGSATAGRGATLLGRDREHDLALLRIDGAPLPALAAGRRAARARRCRRGDHRLSDRRGAGLHAGDPSRHRLVDHRHCAARAGAQSLNSQAINRLRQGSFDIYQLDATAYPGNSGGPVLEVESGKVIAVINMVLVKGSKETAISHPSGISYAIPVRFVSELLKGR